MDAVGCLLFSSVRNYLPTLRGILSFFRGRGYSVVYVVNSVVGCNPHGEVPRNVSPGKVIRQLGSLTSGVMTIENGYSTRMSRVLLSFPVVRACTLLMSGNGQCLLARKRVCGGSGVPGNPCSTVVCNRSRL